LSPFPQPAPAPRRSFLFFLPTDFPFDADKANRFCFLLRSTGFIIPKIGSSIPNALVGPCLRSPPLVLWEGELLGHLRQNCVPPFFDVPFDAISFSPWAPDPPSPAFQFRHVSSGSKTYSEQFFPTLPQSPTYASLPRFPFPFPLRLCERHQARKAEFAHLFPSSTIHLMGVFPPLWHDN